MLGLFHVSLTVFFEEDPIRNQASDRLAHPSDIFLLSPIPRLERRSGVPDLLAFDLRDLEGPERPVKSGQVVRRPEFRRAGVPTLVCPERNFQTGRRIPPRPLPSASKAGTSVGNLSPDLGGTIVRRPSVQKSGP